MSGAAGPAFRHFDPSSSANLWRSIGMTADFSVAARFSLKALSKTALSNVEGNKSKQ
jgi:hypothetical protein